MVQEIRNRTSAAAVCVALLALSGCGESLGTQELSAAADPANPPPAPPATVNTPPTMSGVPTTTLIVGGVWSFTPNASDGDGDPLTFSIENQPDWAAFDDSNGTLSGTPQPGQEGSYPDIVIKVSDGQAVTGLPAFTMSVQNPNPGSNRAPQISGTPPASVLVGAQYSFQPTASDPDGDSLQFSIANRPLWASFSSTTGRLRGTPNQSDAGMHGDIRISVSDGEFTNSLPAFAITVEEAPNNPPQISGIPSTSATVGQAYSFQPTASDPDGDTLTFSISNMPAWASFNAVTGRLSGTPVQGDIGAHDDIQISVSDGELASSLPTFAISVLQQATGSTTLTWTAPTTNTDGSSLEDLVAYKVYYGTSPDSYPNEIRIDNSGMTSFVVEDLSPNTYYFVMTSVNDREIESEYSGMATISIE